MHCLDSEDEVRRLLLLAHTSSTALDRLRRFWAHWHSESYRVNVINDRQLIDRVARMTVNGPLAAFVVFTKPALNTSHVAAKLVSGGPIQKMPPFTGPPPAHVTNPSTAAPKHLALNPRGEAIGAPPLAALRLAATAPIATDIAPPTYEVRILSAERRIEQVLRRAPPYLPPAMRGDFWKFSTSELQVTTIGVFAVWAGSHLHGIEFIVDSLLTISGVAFLETGIVDTAETLYRSLELTVQATEEKQLEEAAKLLAAVVTTLGVQTFIAMIAHGATRTASSAAEGKKPERKPSYRARAVQARPEIRDNFGLKTGIPTTSRKGSTPRTICFDAPKGFNADQIKEFERQLKEQQDTINKMKPEDILRNMAEYDKVGRDPDDPNVRKRYRRGYEKRLRQEIEEALKEEGVPEEEARTSAKQLAKDSAKPVLTGRQVTHGLDQRAGGDRTEEGISGLGDSKPNERIGGQWVLKDITENAKGKEGKIRADKLKDISEEAAKNGEKMDVILKIC